MNLGNSNCPACAAALSMIISCWKIEMENFPSPRPYKRRCAAVIRMDEPTVSHSMLLLCALAKPVYSNVYQLLIENYCSHYSLYFCRKLLFPAQNQIGRAAIKSKRRLAAHAANFPQPGAQQRESFSLWLCAANSVSIVIGRCALCPLLSEWG